MSNKFITVFLTSLSLLLFSEVSSAAALSFLPAGTAIADAFAGLKTGAETLNTEAWKIVPIITGFFIMLALFKKFMRQAT